MLRPSGSQLAATGSVASDASYVAMTQPTYPRPPEAQSQNGTISVLDGRVMGALANQGDAVMLAGRAEIVAHGHPDLSTRHRNPLRI
jgi:hypothetical protein